MQEEISFLEASRAWKDNMTPSHSFREFCICFSLKKFVWPRYLVGREFERAILILISLFIAAL